MTQIEIPGIDVCEADFARFRGMVPVEPNEGDGPIVRPDVPLGRPALDDSSSE